MAVKATTDPQAKNLPKGSVAQSARTHPTDEQIRDKAYQIYQARGNRPGSAMDDWLQAERALRPLK